MSKERLAHHIPSPGVQLHQGVGSQEPIAIDWTNAYVGNPLGDVAWTCLMLQSPFMPPGTPKIIRFLAKFIKRITCETYLSEYIRLSKAKVEDVEAWMLPVATARLREKIPLEEKWLISLIDNKLCSVHK